MKILQFRNSDNTERLKNNQQKHYAQNNKEEDKNKRNT